MKYSFLFSVILHTVIGGILIFIFVDSYNTVSFSAIKISQIKDIRTKTIKKKINKIKTFSSKTLKSLRNDEGENIIFQDTQQEESKNTVYTKLSKDDKIIILNYMQKCLQEVNNNLIYEVTAYLKLFLSTNGVIADFEVKAENETVIKKIEEHLLKQQCRTPIELNDDYENWKEIDMQVNFKN